MVSGSIGIRRAGGLALLLALAAPAVAQQPSGAEAGQGMTSRMILELQQMREEVRELRGLVEAQAQEIENLKRRQRDQFIDLDTRVSALASGGAASSRTPSSAGPAAEARPGPAVGAGSGRPSPERPVVASPDRAPPPPVAAPEVREEVDPEPEIVTLAEPGSAPARALAQPTAAEQQAYDGAFLALREARYADAAEGFDRFLRDHPQSSYAPNALYWLGEVYYVTRDFQTALDQFQRLLQVYPDSSKVPDALLKVGFSHYELGNWEQARAALEQVIADHPGTNYSRLAENRLRTMRLEGHL